MKIRLFLTASLSAIGVCASPSISAAPPTSPPATAACPTGQVVQAIDFAKRTVTCVALPTGSGKSALHVVDNNGQFVGMLVDSGLLLRKFNDKWYLFFGSQGDVGFVESGVSLFYESSDCTGPGFILNDESSLLPGTFNVGSGASTTFYVPTPGTATTIIYSSFLNINAATPAGVCGQPREPASAPVAVPMQVNVNTTLPWRVTD